MDYRDWGRGELTRPMRRQADAWVDDGDPRPGDPYSHTGEGYQPEGRRRGAHRSDPDRYTPSWALESPTGGPDDSGRHRDGEEQDRPWADTAGFDPPRTEASRKSGRDTGSGSPATDYWTAPTAWSATEPSGGGGRRGAEVDERRPGRAGRHADDQAEENRDDDGYGTPDGRSGGARRSGTTWSDGRVGGSATAPGGSSTGGRRRSDRRDPDRSGDRPAGGRDDVADTSQWSAIGGGSASGRRWSRTGTPRRDDRSVETGRWDQFTDTGVWHWGSEDERPEPVDPAPRSSRTGRADRTSRPDRTGRSDRTSGAERPHERVDREERGGRAGRATPVDRTDRAAGSDPTARTTRGDRTSRSDRTGRGEWAGPRTTVGTGETAGTRGRRYRSDQEPDALAAGGGRSRRDRTTGERPVDGPATDARTGADRAPGERRGTDRTTGESSAGGRSRDRFAETGQWNRVTDADDRAPGTGRRHRAEDTGQWDRLTDTGQWDRFDDADSRDREPEPRVWSSFTDTGQWDRFTDTGVWDRSELAALEEQEEPDGDGPSWRNRGAAFWAGTRLADDDPRWMETPTSAPRSPAVAYPRPPRITPPGPPASAVPAGRVAPTPVEPRTGQGRRNAPSGRTVQAGRVAETGRVPQSSPPQPVGRASRPVRRIEEDLLDAEPGTHLAAVLYTAAWYAVPVLVFFIWLVTLDNSPPPGCVTDPAGGGCDSDRAQALSSILGAAPRFGAALMGSLVVAVLLRWVSKAWRPASLGLASAVVGGGLSTVLYSVITGQPLG